MSQKKTEMPRLTICPSEGKSGNRTAHFQATGGERKSRRKITTQTHQWAGPLHLRDRTGPRSRSGRMGTARGKEYRGEPGPESEKKVTHRGVKIEGDSSFSE